ncbi:class I SAM-dependent methyltransferase [Dinoroseobacter shibae]|uniref:class I SAM-dependent methyltransferase n=1 Tax=Dinoroseobacter shibae TaxID=215813 RepID=UPI00031200DE|nr:methyltransferase domain-containing protein [Dinoroseobacter shibae]URF46094.1 class I SAM-dependent methyltransferase [Dinoroseobacter shibae]URF50401.1 class I SAM-dependent methyltransferase [Dinoroseobacter shibae]
MHLDVLDLRQFYYRTRLGRVAQGAIRDALLYHWPDAEGQTVVGFGFAVPLLRPYLTDARRVIGLMPGPQGVMHWPAGMPNISVLCDERSWPLETGGVDKLVLLHGLETSETPTDLLEECWRVLSPGGRAMFIVPNRAGLWARKDGTPFGYGRPYSLGQLEAQLTKHGFVNERHASALFTPPSEKRFWLRSTRMVEKTGQNLSAVLGGGVFLVEVSKQVFEPLKADRSKGLRRPLRVLEGIPAPGAKPV